MKKVAIIISIITVLMLLPSCITIGTSEQEGTGRLTVLDHKLVGLDTGNVQVQATIKNPGSSTIKTAEITVMFYRADNALISTGKATVTNLTAGETKVAIISCTGAGCSEVNSYNLEYQAKTS